MSSSTKTALRIDARLALNAVAEKGPVSRAELAAVLGIVCGTLNPYLGGHRGEPDTWGPRGRVTLPKIAAALGCPAKGLHPGAPVFFLGFGLD